MRRAKTIDELYEEVKGFDLVLCNDAPLALALNNRLDFPRIGTFATTPRKLARDLAMNILGKPMISDLEAVRFVSNVTGYPFRFVHGEILNIRTIRRYTADVRSRLRSDKSREIYDEYSRLPTLDRAMEVFDGEKDPFFVGKRIAVIGEEMYDSLDKHFNPGIGNFESVSPFMRGKFNIPKFRELSNDRQIAVNVAGLIDVNNAYDIAIVMDVGSPIADAIRSELYRNKIPFKNVLEMRDLNSIRDYIEFITKSHNFQILKVSQVREMFSSFGGRIPGKYDEYLIEKYSEGVTNERTSELFEIMRDVESFTYGEVCDRVLGRDGVQVRLLLEQMNLTEISVNTTDTDDMVYAVNNFTLKHSEQIPMNEKEGVLLVDCKNSVYVDRPVVIFLGMGQEWEKDISELNIIDPRMKEDVIEVDTDKFQILLQQGSVQLYICNSVRDGKRPRPCSYFERSESGAETVTYSTFIEIAECIRGNWVDERSESKISVGTFSISEDNGFQFSNSSYSIFRSCPRQFMFSRLLGIPDTGNMALGNMLHEYAEFRMCFPEKVKEMGREHFVKRISEKCVGLFTPDIRDIKESNVRSSVICIDTFIETKGLDKAKVTEKKRKKPNMFFEEMGLETMGSQMNELELASPNRHMGGIFDVLDGSDIYDFKTGKRKDGKEVYKDMALKEKTQFNKNFQGPFYLSLLEEHGRGNETFNLLYTSANEYDFAQGRMPSPKDLLVISMELIDDIDVYLRGRLFEDEFENVAKYRPLGGIWEEFIDACISLGRESLTKNGNQAVESFLKRFEIKDNKTNRGMLADALKKIAIPMGKDILCVKNRIYITRPGLERFRGDIQRAYEDVLAMSNGRFPAEPTIQCPRCSFRKQCTIEPSAGDSDE